MIGCCKSCDKLQPIIVNYFRVESDDSTGRKFYEIASWWSKALRSRIVDRKYNCCCQC